MESEVRTKQSRTFQTLKKRAEFQRVRGGGRATAAAFILEGKLRQKSLPPDTLTKKPTAHALRSHVTDGPRFGFTITKKIGNAVIRNRIRRRLRAALVQISPLVARPGTDYVLVARLPASSQNFASLVADLKVAFERVHAPTSKASPSPKPNPKSEKPRPDEKGVTEGLSRPSPRSATSTQQNKSSRD